MHIVVERRPEGIALTDDSGHQTLVSESDFSRAVVVREAGPERPRWVWSDTAKWYPALLAAGVRIERCHDLRLVDGLLCGIAGQVSEHEWGSAPRPALADTLFDFVAAPDAVTGLVIGELWAQQRAAIAAHPAPLQLAVLVAAESAGALAAAEMQHAGVPWSADAHDALLTEALGPRPALGQRPAQLEALAAQFEALLGVGRVAIDSPPELVKALRRAGLEVSSTRSSELGRVDHPAIEPLLRYKTLSRLHSSNGWHWLEEWVRHGRFRPTFIPGGVVTGRWASAGGGALQLPRQVRSAVQADEGWRLVVADAAQLEPRILAALSGDAAMAQAGAGADLYAGIVSSGAVATREQAKLGMLGAMYGATRGVSAQILPRLARSFPDALGFVERAARAGERGERVQTRLGRTSPWPTERVGDEGAQGRFTRNFVVQGTAAEWALAWLAGVRNRLWNAAAGTLTEQPHLVFFVHDELVVHAPLGRVSEVEQALHDAAADAARVVFGGTSVTFPVTVASVQRYSDAK